MQHINLIALVGAFTLNYIYIFMLLLTLATISVWAVWRTLDTLARHLDNFPTFIVALFALLPLALGMVFSMATVPSP